MKLSLAQQRFMDVVDGKAKGLARNRRERDGTVAPFATESRTVDSLIRLGIVRWTSAGSEGFVYTGVTRVAAAQPSSGVEP